MKTAIACRATRQTEAKGIGNYDTCDVRLQCRDDHCGITCSFQYRVIGRTQAMCEVLEACVRHSALAKQALRALNSARQSQNVTPARGAFIACIGRQPDIIGFVLLFSARPACLLPWALCQMTRPREFRYRILSRSKAFVQFLLRQIERPFVQNLCAPNALDCKGLQRAA